MLRVLAFKFNITHLQWYECATFVPEVASSFVISDSMLLQKFSVASTNTLEWGTYRLLGNTLLPSGMNQDTVVCI